MIVRGLTKRTRPRVTAHPLGGCEKSLFMHRRGGYQPPGNRNRDDAPRRGRICTAHVVPRGRIVSAPTAMVTFFPHGPMRASAPTDLYAYAL